MTAIEKLARRICWLGFAQPSKTGWTEAAYWRSLPPEMHEKYLEEASWLEWIVGKLDDSGSGWELLKDARRSPKKPVKEAT